MIFAPIPESLFTAMNLGDFMSFFSRYGLGRTLFLWALFAAVTVPTAVTKIKYVAVVETELDDQSGAAAKLNKAEVRQITAVLRNEARNNMPSGTYKIMTAETVIAQGTAKLEECVEENCVIALGNKIGADYIVRGIVSMFGTELTLSVEMYETEDGTLVGSSRVSSERPKELLDRTVADCRVLYRTFVNEMNAAQKTPSQQTPFPAPPEVVATPQPTYQPPPPTYQPPAPTYQPSAPTYTPMPAPAYQRFVADGSDVFTDGRDGKRYRTVVIGGKRWMAQNLNYLTSKGSWCYDDNNYYCNKYGGLYDWNTAKAACPTGWHLPNRQEWNQLVTATGGDDAGTALKTRAGWVDNGNGADYYNFSALPGGSRSVDGSFKNAGNRGIWWTGAEYDSDSAYYKRMGYNYDYVYEGTYGKWNGFSVRCVQN